MLPLNPRLLWSKFIMVGLSLMFICNTFIPFCIFTWLGWMLIMIFANLKFYQFWYESFIKYIFGNQFNITIKQDKANWGIKNSKVPISLLPWYYNWENWAVAVIWEPCKHLVKYISICYNSCDKVARDNLGYIRKNKL